MNPRLLFFSLTLLHLSPALVPASPLFDDATEVRMQPSDIPDATATLVGALLPADVEMRAESIAGEPAPLPTPLKLSPHQRFQRDFYPLAFEILKEDNSCSRFFGGAPKALRALNGFTELLEQRRLVSRSVAIMMSGPYSINVDAKTGAKYRLFREMAVNSSGPLYAISLDTQNLKFIGRFWSNTKQAKVLALLHELGHLVEGAGGAWLLPNDGHDMVLSERNTQIVERQCIKQLLAIKN